MKSQDFSIIENSLVIVFKALGGAFVMFFFAAIVVVGYLILFDDSIESLSDIPVWLTIIAILTIILPFVAQTFEVLFTLLFAKKTGVMLPLVAVFASKPGYYYLETQLKLMNSFKIKPAATPTGLPKNSTSTMNALLVPKDHGSLAFDQKKHETLTVVYFGLSYFVLPVVLVILYAFLA